MTTQQPEALRIADELENTRIDGASAECFYTLCRAADLLRLLHARVQEVGAVAKREHARVQELERAVADEREACAAACERLGYMAATVPSYAHAAYMDCARVIRARDDHGGADV